MVRKTVISQLQSVGEGALGKLAQSPATRGAVQGAVQVKERGERLLRTLESIDTRLATIEERLTTLEHPKPKRVSTPRASARSADPGAGKAEAGS